VFVWGHHPRTHKTKGPTAGAHVVTHEAVRQGRRPSEGTKKEEEEEVPPAGRSAPASYPSVKKNLLLARQNCGP
jgi:hypothetical protein